MSSKLLGQTFDIHGGGKDLIFPHHENEIAQSEGASGKPFARYWMHNGFVNINQEKMSKSLGNFLMIKDVLKSYHPEAVRLFLLSSHYRSPIDFTDKAMDEADSGLDKIYALTERVRTVTGQIPGGENTAGESWNRFAEAMDDDFNTAKGIGVLFETVRQINRILDENRLSPEMRQSLLSETGDILKMGGILGILTESPQAYFEKKKMKGLADISADSALIDRMIQERKEARKTKNWAKADQIRKQLDEMNIVLEDRPEGTFWKINK